MVEPQLWFHLRTGAMLTAHADDLMLAAPPGAREELMHNLGSKMRVKWGECLKVGVMSEWVRFLGKEMRRTKTGYELRIPLGYMKGILELLHLKKTKGAPTPFLSISIKLAEEPQLCDIAEHHLYRQVVGKMMWLASDRPDVKELARALQQPGTEDMQKLKRLGKYLANALNMVSRLDVNMKQSLTEVRVMTDANWAAAPDRRSTSGGWITVASFPILHYSRTLSAITQSTCESELLAMSAGAIEGKLVQNILKESGLPATLVLITDSSSAKQVTLRRGPGRMRHLDMRQQWLQDELRAGRITVTTVTSAANVSDLFTKALAKNRIEELNKLAGLVRSEDNSSDPVL